MEIVKLIGTDVLPDDQKLIIETARIIRSGFLQQNAFHPVDTYVPLTKQYWMMKVILHYYDRAQEIVGASIPLARLIESGIGEKLIKIKFDVGNDHIDSLAGYCDEIDSICDEIIVKNKV